MDIYRREAGSPCRAARAGPADAQAPASLIPVPRPVLCAGNGGGLTTPPAGPANDGSCRAESAMGVASRPVPPTQTDDGRRLCDAAHRQASATAKGRRPPRPNGAEQPTPSRGEARELRSPRLIASAHPPACPPAPDGRIGGRDRGLIRVAPRNRTSSDDGSMGPPPNESSAPTGTNRRRIVCQVPIRRLLCQRPPAPCDAASFYHVTRMALSS